MIFSQKKYVLFFIFIVFAFALFFPETSWAQTDIYRTTPCGEEVKIGWYQQEECCHSDDCCTTDADGGCVYDGCCTSNFCNRYRCNESWWEYRSTTEGCEPTVHRRQCRSFCSNTYGESCCNWCRACDFNCGIWETGEIIAPSEPCEQCESWQRAVSDTCENPDSTDWCPPPKPKCTCCGCPGDTDCDPAESCVEAPTGLEIYQSPFSNIREDPLDNIRLPVRLTWEDVPGWGGGWDGAKDNMQAYFDCIRNNDHVDRCRQQTWDNNPDANCWGELVLEYIECLESLAQEECQSLIEEEECDATCPLLGDEDPECYTPGEFVESYRIEITGELRSCEDGSDMPGYSAVLHSSDFIPPCPCFFKSNRTYTWKVRACCSEDGYNCGPWSEINTFTTSLAPEPIWPHDPDWIGPDRAQPIWQNPTEEEPYPVRLEWCPVEEAESYCIRMYKEGDPFCPTLYGPLYCPTLVPPIKGAPIQSYVKVGLEVFTKETEYQWKVATCLRPDELGFQCGLASTPDQICYTLETLDIENPVNEFSQLWKFFGDVTLTAPEIVFPEDGDCVNLTHELNWRHVSGARSYRYEIYRINATSDLLINEAVSEKFIPTTYLWGKGILTFNEKYGWRVKPCWDEDGDECEEDSWSNGGELWEFTTTGAAPDLLSPDHEASDVPIPINLNWEDVQCAASYVYEVTTDANFDDVIFQGILAGLGVPSSEISISYNPGLDHPIQLTDYWWRIKTCADKESLVCGEWSNEHRLTTFELAAPELRHPPDNGDFFTHENIIRWSRVTGGEFYEYEIYDQANVMIIDVPGNIVPVNWAHITTGKLELGTYTWRVRACLEADCNHHGPFSDFWTFNLVEGDYPSTGGLVPCGRFTHNPETPWNEREPCGVQHIFIMIYMVISYVLWKLIPVVLVLLIIASAIIFYFSGQLGIPDPTVQVKSIWKAVGIGLLVAFLAWIITSVVLGLLGYRVGIFGTWWIFDF